MNYAAHADPIHCPAPWERAPRAVDGAASDRLYPAPPALQGVMAALIRRDTSRLVLADAQRLSHFPASPLVALSWYHGLDAGLVTAGGDSKDSKDSPAWQPFGARVVLSGSQSRPLATWAPTTGRGYMACFSADVAQALFGLDLAAIHDRFVPATAVLDAGWAPLFNDLLRAADDGATMAALEQHLTARWRAVKGEPSPLASVRRLGRHWVERLALKAHAWQRDVGPRHVERRIKSYSGRSLREWQSLVRTEGLFFAARDRYEAGVPFNWADLAQEHGFADQAHMSRAARQITGFPPGEFAQRFIEDESFWVYRLWV
jgi:AraC-like DNA-binding protein